MNGTAFRAATSDDVPKLMGFIRALAGEDGAAGFDAARAESALRELLAGPDLGEAWLIERDGAAAGYVVLTWGFSLEFHGRDAFIDEIFIVPAERGRGLGQVAVEHAAARCRARGIGALHLEVDPDNERAISLYRRCGFVPRAYRLMSRRLSR